MPTPVRFAPGQFRQVPAKTLEISGSPYSAIVAVVAIRPEQKVSSYTTAEGLKVFSALRKFFDT
jgi:hypothetical protein